MSVLVGQKAPDFTAPAVLADGEIVNNFKLSEYLDGSYGVLFFWPLDFTFVCPSEILAYGHRAPAFEAMNTKLIGVSIDSQFTHNAWRNTPQKEGGLGEVPFPMVADIKREITSQYGVLHDSGVALRGTFLIDGEGFVRHQLVNDLPLGRNADEAVRMVEALQFHEENGEVCPAGWRPGQEAMQASPAGVASYLAEHAESL